MTALRYNYKSIFQINSQASDKSCLNSKAANRCQKFLNFGKGQITIGFLRIKKNDNYWLLYHVGRVTNDLNVFNGMGYEYETLTEYEKYFGRLIVRFKNTVQAMVRRATEVIDLCEVAQILPDVYDNDLFPGYDKVNISWQEHIFKSTTDSQVINERESWWKEVLMTRRFGYNGN